jgi:hypothetical protein
MEKRKCAGNVGWEDGGEDCATTMC